VVPVEALAQGTSLRLYPDDGCKSARFEKYREAWDLFRGEGSGGAGEDGTVAAGENLDLVDDSIALAFARWRPPVWKPPRFFWAVGMPGPRLSFYWTDRAALREDARGSIAIQWAHHD